MIIVIILIIVIIVIILIIVMFRFASITINLGPTFLSGALAANLDDHVHEPSCPIVQVGIKILMIIMTNMNMMKMIMLIRVHIATTC